MNAETRNLRGTLIGLTAILMWATFSTLTAFCKAVPPFQMTAMAFAVAAGIGFAWMAGQGRRARSLLQVPGRAWALGVFGLFGFHFFYFMALKNAPVVEARLIAYLWPLLSTWLLVALGLAEPSWSLIAACLLIVGGSLLASRPTCGAETGIVPHCQNGAIHEIH